MISTSILIIDDDNDVCRVFKWGFENSNFVVETANNLSDAKALIESKKFDCVLTDVFLGYENSIEKLSEFIQNSPNSRFFIFTSKESIPLAVKSIGLGASDFFPKTLGVEKIIELIKAKVIRQEDKNYPTTEFEAVNIIGRSAVMKDVVKKMTQYKDVNSTVLITGESGTGKELVAQGLHKISRRASKPFEAINCGAIPETLLESELFGHKKGAFTDAKTEKIGLFEACTDGTLMLDEIGDMPLPLQVKLLRVLQEKEVRPLGSTKSVKVNPRIIACTHRDLNELVERGEFRQDLLFRLSVLQLKIPPLRDRKEDMPVLVNTFIKKYNVQFSKNVEPPTTDLMIRLRNYDWPGNIRELQNAIERGVVLTRDNLLHFEDLSLDHIVKHASRMPNNGHEVALAHEEAKRNFEKKYIENLLTESEGNISKAARLSGKHRVEIYRLMGKYNISREDYFKAKAL